MNAISSSLKEVYIVQSNITVCKLFQISAKSCATVDAAFSLVNADVILLKSCFMHAVEHVKSVCFFFSAFVNIHIQRYCYWLPDLDLCTVFFLFFFVFCVFFLTVVESFRHCYTVIVMAI